MSAEEPANGEKYAMFLLLLYSLEISAAPKPSKLSKKVLNTSPNEA
jgi:hypothetical protein